MNKSNVRYVLNSATLRLSEDTVVDTYGLDIIRDGAKVKSYYDIFLDRKKVEELVKMCNELDVSPLHIPEILEDILP